MKRMNGYNKHYIRIESGVVVHGFSDAFEEPRETDICITETGGRQFEIDGEINPSLYDEKGCHVYRYEDGLRKSTEEELAFEWEQIKPEPQIDEEATTLDLLADHEFRLCMLELM